MGTDRSTTIGPDSRTTPYRRRRADDTLAAVTVELPEPIRAFHDAQRRAFHLLGDVVRRLEAGMSERDIYEVAETRLEPNGFTTWYHPPEVHIRRNGSPRWPFPSARRTLAVGDILTLDMGPGTTEAYGDAGYSFEFGATQEPAVVKVARECVKACCGYSSRWKTIGEIYIFARAWAINHRMDLAGTGAVGHRVLPRGGLFQAGFPRSAHAGTLLARNRMHRLNPVRMDGMFAIRPEVRDQGRTAAFEEIVYVHEDVRVVLGRNGLDEVGTLPTA